MAEYDTINGEDILSNSLRAIKQYIPQKLDEVKKHAQFNDKKSTTYAQECAYDQGYTKALQDLLLYIKSMGV